YAALVELRRIELDFPGDNDHRRAFAMIGVQAEVADATGHQQADIAIAHFIAPAGFQDRLHDFSMPHREGEQDGLGGTEQAINVLAQLEHAPVVSADALEDAVPVEQPVIEDRNLRLALVAKLSVNENLHGWGVVGRVN